MLIFYFLLCLIIFCALVDIIGEKFRLFPIALSASITMFLFLMSVELNYLIVIFIMMSLLFNYIKVKNVKTTKNVKNVKNVKSVKKVNKR